MSTSDELVMIRDARVTVGNCCMWWRPDGQGYTCNVDEAWRLPRAQAALMDWRDSDEILPAALVESLSVRHFDMQLLPRVRKRAPHFVKARTTR